MTGPTRFSRASPINRVETLLKAGVLKELRIPRWKDAEAQELRQALGRSLSIWLEFDEPAKTGRPVG